MFLEKIVRSAQEVQGALGAPSHLDQPLQGAKSLACDLRDLARTLDAIGEGKPFTDDEKMGMAMAVRALAKLQPEEGLRLVA